MYLRKKGYANNTVCIYITPLRKMISIAQNNGWIDYNPFANDHVPLQRRGREHLSLAEIERLLNVDLKQGRGNIEFIRDLFVFCIFTGISYIDMVNLTSENVKQQDNDIWISFTRQKTNIVCEIPLLRIPLAILEKYKGVQKGKFLFEVPSYTGFLYGIRKVARLCGIERHITWHCARHLFFLF